MTATPNHALQRTAPQSLSLGSLAAFTRMLQSALLSSLLFALCGCASPWPDLPPTEYTGTVFNGPLNRPEPKANVFASRPGMRGVVFALVPSQSIGRTMARPDGTFRLRTTTGYASDLRAGSADGRLSAQIPVRSHRDNIILRIEPSLRSIAYREVDPLSDTAKTSEAAIRSIMLDISKQPNQRPQSLRDYARRGIITDQQFSIFVAHPRLFFGASPSIEYHWGDHTFLFRDATTPLTFRATNGG